MNILYLTLFFPFPSDSGAKMRGQSILKALAKQHKVTLFSFLEEGDEEYLPQAQEYCSRVEVFSRHKKLSATQRFLNFFSPTPDLLLQNYSSKLKSRVETIVKEERIEVILVEVLFMMSHIPKDLNKKIYIILDELNVEYKVLKSFARVAPFFSFEGLVRKIYYYIQAFKLKKIELQACRQADKVFIVSESEKQTLLSYLPNLNIEVLPNAVDTEFFAVLPPPQEPHSLIFVGSMFYRPNTDAILWFCEKVLPLLKTKIPNVKLYIVGKEPPPRLRILSKDPSIVVTGYVEDLQEYYEKATVAIAPIITGSGTKLKILEAMALGRPVISTTKGVEGLEVSANSVLIADTPLDFANQTGRLLKDGSLQRKIALNGRKLVESKYSWKLVEQKVETVFAQVEWGLKKE